MDGVADTDTNGEPSGAQRSSSTHPPPTSANETVQRLVELRLYLERGVKPLENKLHYQIDRAVRAADDYNTRAQQRSGAVGKKGQGKLHTSKNKPSDDDDDDDDSASDAESMTSTASSASSDGSSRLGLTSRPNLASFIQPSPVSNPSSSKRIPSSASTSAAAAVYKPPRIAPTALPSTTPGSSSNKPTARSRKSNLLDDYVSTELSSVPVAEPSIGANIVDRGRRDVLNARERAVAGERQRYEEENLVRLPGMSKKEKRVLGGDRMRRGQFGGEEWSGLGGSAERIVDLVRKKNNKGVLERSRKRGRDDGVSAGGGGGGGIGVAFEKRRKVLEQRKRK